MGYKGRLILLVVVFATSAEFTTYDYINDFSAVKWDLLMGAIISILSWWFGIQYDKAKYYSQRDVLTGTYNRLFSPVMFTKLLKRVERLNKNLIVFVVDINDLKKINDLYGHITGDKVIQYVSYTLMACTQKYDFVTRWGGDEFVITASRKDQEEVSDMIEKIREHIFAVKVSNEKSFKPSISIGTAWFPVDGRALDELIRVADARMYNFKKEYKAQHTNANLIHSGGKETYY